MTCIFTTEQSDLRHLSGKTCERLRALTVEEADPEVGPMFKVQFEAGVEIDAFADELAEGEL